MDIQIQLLNDLKERAQSAKHFVEELENLLSIERSAVYNRLNGTTRLTIDELLLILKHYQPVDNPFEAVWPTRVMVDYQALGGNPEDFKSYMTPVVAILLKILPLPNHHLYYAANELPFLHFFRMPELALFKYYVWSHFAWATKGFERAQFDQSFLDVQLPLNEATFHQITDLYNRIPSTEIWHTNLITNTLNQISYLHAIHLLPDNAIVLRLLNQLGSLLEHIEDMAARGYKTVDRVAPFRLYHNEVAFTNNVGLIHSSGFSAVHFAYDNPNFMSSVDRRLCIHTKKFIDNLVTHATLLSESSNKPRMMFFRRLREQLDEVQEPFRE